MDRHRTAIYLTLLCLGIHVHFVYSKYRIVSNGMVTEGDVCAGLVNC